MNFGRSALTLMILAALFSNRPAFAGNDPIELFEPSAQPKLDYNKQVQELEIHPEGKILKFTSASTGAVHEFRLLSYLGKGTTTLVFRAQPLEPDDHEEIALRIPIATDVQDGDHRFLRPSQLINETIDGYNEFRAQGVPIPGIYNFARSQFVAVELIHHDFDGQRFFSHPEGLPENVLTEARHALMEFARTTKNFNRLNDFKAQQLVYNIALKKWFLLDYRISGRRVPFNKETVFESNSFLRSLTDIRRGPYSQNPTLTSREAKLIELCSESVQAARKTAIFSCIAGKLRLRQN